MQCKAMSRLVTALLRVLLAPVLWWRSRPSLVVRALSSRAYECAEKPGSRITRVGVVQFQARLMSSAAEYADAMYELVWRAVQGGAHLIVFPEDTGSYPLGGLIPGLRRLVGGGTDGRQVEEFESGAAPMALLLRILSPASARVYRTTFSILARRFGVHIVGGSGLSIDEQGLVRKTGCLFAPDGRLAGTQTKTHLYPAEAGWGLGRGDEIEVFDTPAGRISFPICMDHTYYEPIRIAWLKGAEIIIDPAANAAEYNYWAQSRGVWGRVQESPAYGIGCFMVGRLLGVQFGGRSGVYAPLEMTEGATGILAQSESWDSEEVLFADLDLERIRGVRREHRRRLNVPLYERYLPSAYHRYLAGEVNGRRTVA
jgi:predicted amidohydrolase